MRAALDRQGIKEADIKLGAAVFFNTGSGALWMKNNDRLNAGEPGIGLQVARWVVEKKLALVGSDTWGTEVAPNPDKKLAFAAHGELITRNGIFDHENLAFDEMLRDRRYPFVYIVSPTPIKGTTGSAGGPVAVV